MQMSFMHFCTYAIAPTDRCIQSHMRVQMLWIAREKLYDMLVLNKSFDEENNGSVQGKMYV